MFQALPLLLLFPALGYLLSRRIALAPESPGRTAGRMLGLFALGLFAGSPFLTSRGVGTGEAYNYSLALADAVTQMRVGEIPPLVGQTEFAFNGRVHPLRTAPYLFYLAGGIDTVTARSLSFWELQNLSLALSLMGMAFAMYGALRWGTLCNRPTALALTAVATLCPALLNAVTVNLYMTVHAAPFVAVAAGACLRHSRHSTPFNDLILGAALGAAWLAHPPVALWMTGALAIIRGALLWHDPSWQARYGLLAGLLLGATLASFAFVSSGSLSRDLSILRDNDILHRDYITMTMDNLRDAFPGSLLPVSRQANTLADFQLGYPVLGLLAGLLVTLIRRRPHHRGFPLERTATGSVLLGCATLLVLCLPIPGLTAWLWARVPTTVMNITAVWPMQRLYLVATILAVFGAATQYPSLISAARSRWARVGLGAGLLAVLLQATPFVIQGFRQRWTEDKTRRAHLGSNVDLTIISYAYLALPENFTHGTRDPRFEFRLVRRDGTEANSNLAAALATGRVTNHGTIRIEASAASGAPAKADTPLELQPGRKYLLTFRFAQPDLSGHLVMEGPALKRSYILSASGGPRGFGTEEGKSHSLPLWTSLSTSEMVNLSLIPTPSPTAPAAGAMVAEYELLEVDPAKLPVRIRSLAPLRFQLDVPEADLALILPRAFLPDYVAVINGRKAQPLRSADGQLALMVPRGQSEIEVRYEGGPYLRVAFWTSAAAWAGLFCWFGARLAGLNERALGQTFLAAGKMWPAAVVRHRRWLLAGLAVLVIGLLGLTLRLRYLNAFGPVRVRFLVPPGNFLREPILSTGHKGAGTIVMIDSVDANHIRVGAEIWGSLLMSEPVAIDRTQAQEIIMSSSALFPLNHPRALELDTGNRALLRNEFRVELNGQVVLRELRDAYESRPDEIEAGKNTIGSSHARASFAGRILEVTRERIPLAKVLPLGRGAAQLDLSFAVAPSGTTEPIVALGREGEYGLLAAHWLTSDRLRLIHFRSDGTIAAAEDVPFQANRAVTLEIFLASETEGSGLLLTGRMDGQPIFGMPGAPILGRPVFVVAGVNRGAIPGVESSFTSGTLRWRNNGSATAQLHGTGRLRMQVMFPRNKAQQSEPLVTTGVAGKGDFAYVIYLGDQGIRVGVDHWGVRGITSDPLAIDYSQPHEILVSFGSFFPEADDPRWAEAGPESRREKLEYMVIQVDGKELVRTRLSAHRVDPATITVGRNTIGGSSTGESFTGQILDFDWGGPVP